MGIGLLAAIPDDSLERIFTALGAFFLNAGLIGLALRRDQPVRKP